MLDLELRLAVRHRGEVAAVDGLAGLGAPGREHHRLLVRRPGRGERNLHQGGLLEHEAFGLEDQAAEIDIVVGHGGDGDGGGLSQRARGHDEGRPIREHQLAAIRRDVSGQSERLVGGAAFVGAA